MFRKQFKWFIYFAAPLVLLAIPFGTGINLKKYFQTIVLQPQKTGISTFNFYDAERDRPLTTEIWYPIDLDTPAESATGVWIRCDEAREAALSTKKEKYPLIVISHGNRGDRFNISWLAEVLAANGYIVAAMDHYGNTWNNVIPKCCATPWERPKDVSFVLDQILTASPFKDHIDQSRIGFAGYSLGGATGIWIAGAQTNEKDVDSMRMACTVELSDIVSDELLDGIDFTQACRSFRDERFTAMFVMAPALGWLFDEKSLESIDIPVYIIAPVKDTVVPFESNAQILAKKIARANLMVLSGDETHFVFLNRASKFGKRFLNAKYCEDPQTIDRKSIHDKVAKTAVEFFQEHF